MTGQVQQPWSLGGKTAIVTGGSRGIGRATAIYLCLDLGVKKAIALQADVLDPQFGPNVVAKVLQGLDTTVIDILVNNAIVTDPSISQTFADTTIDVFSKLMQSNVYAPVSMSAAVMPHLPEYGGRVINISSTAAKVANTDPLIIYGASKAALDSVTRSLAKSFALSKAATFNTVTAGPTATEAFAASKDLLPAGFIDAQVQEFTTAKRLGTPEDIAYIVSFLASEEGRWVNGGCVSANGGYKDALAALG